MKRKLISLLLILSIVAALPWVTPTFAQEGETPYVEGEETALAPVGAGTAEDPYRIYTAEQLSAFSALLADAPASCARLMCDIILNEGLSFEADVDTGLIKVSSADSVGYLGTGVRGYAIANGSVQFDTEASVSGVWYSLTDGSYAECEEAFLTLEKYAPMASAAVPYAGTFDGAGFAIVGAWCVDGDSYAGIFAYLGAGATVKNLTVRNSLFMSSSSGVGAVAGYMHVKSASKCLISDCKNEGTAVVGRSSVAGILGYQNAETNMQSYPLVRDCVNTGDVMARESNAGGIMGGSTRGSVTSSKYGLTANYGTVYAVGDNAGGITTTLVNGNSITNCYNEGDIYAGRYAAGIASQSNRWVERCVNTGSVTAKTYASGIVGFHCESNTVRYCANLGTVTADVCAAGITVGAHNDKRAPQISYCYNAGDIFARVRAAGIVCAAYYMEWVSGETTSSISTTVSFCYSTDSASASEIDADAICPYFDEKASDAVDCEIIKKHDVKSGALAYKFSEVMRQNLASDEYPTPTADANLAIHKGFSSDGYVLYSNSKSEIHRTHVNEDGDCYCDECAYTFSEKHVNADCDCYCDVCGEYDADGHDYTSGGLCKSCGAMRDGASALYAANLRISSGVKLGLIMKLNYAASINPAAYAEISVGNESVKIMVSEAQRSGEYFVFYVDVPAKYFSSDVTIQICGLDIGKGDKYSYSVKKYLEKLDLRDPTLADLTEAVRLWGGAAQEVGKVDTDNLLNDGLSYPSSDEIATGIPTDKVYSSTGEIEGMTMPSKPSITLANSFTVRFTFKGIDGVKFYYGGTEIAPTSLPLQRFAVDVCGLPTTDIAKDITLVAKRGEEVFTVTYSILDEIVKNYNGGNKTDAYLKLFYAVLNYAESTNLKGGTVKLNMNGGTIENDTVIFDGTSDVRLPTEGMNYELGGHKMRFLGWYLDPEFKNAVTVISKNAVGTVNVYAKWDADFLNLRYEGNSVLSEEGESFTDGGVTYAYPEASGARFEVKDGRLVWTSSAKGSYISAKSAVGAMVENLTADGYISYLLTLSEVAMDARFGLSVCGQLFEFFRTTKDGKLLFGDVEIQPDDGGKFEIYAVLRLDESKITLYGKDENEIASRRLLVAYNSSINLLISSSVVGIADGALDILSDSDGSLSILQADVMRAHLFKKNAIDYRMDGATFVEGAEYPENYNTAGEATKLPSADLMYKKNHFFVGWYADADFKIPIDEISIYNVGIATVYAKWNMIFLDVDYDREDAVDPGIFESTGGKSGNGISYNVYGGGVGTYKVFTDENDEKYLLAAGYKNGSQLTATVENKFSAITSPDLSISFVITLGASPYDIVRRPERNEEGELVEYTNVIDESNLTSTYLRLRAGGTDLLYVFNLSTDGRITMGGVEIARLDLETGDPVTLRIVADFKNGNLINYDENGNVLNTVKFSLKSVTSYEQMLRLLNGECFCMRINTDNAAFKLYDVKIVESNVLGK